MPNASLDSTAMPLIELQELGTFYRDTRFLLN